MTSETANVDAVDSETGPRSEAGETAAQNEREIRPPWYRRRKSLRFKIMERLSRLTKGRVKSPGYYRSSDIQREYDVSDIEKYRISPDEHVESWCLWTAEFYTPDNVHRLRTALDRLKPTAFEGAGNAPGDWLRKSRGRAGNSMELYLVPAGGFGWGIGYQCPLPEFAKGAHGTIENITPSLTMLTMHFLLSDAERDWLDKGLHSDRPGRITQKPQGVLGISSVSDEQRRLVEEKRRSWVDQATTWHRKYFPGLLASSGEAVSSCLLDVVDGVEPFGGERSSLLEAIDHARSTDLMEHKAQDEKIIVLISKRFGRDEPRDLLLMAIGKKYLLEFAAPGYERNDDGHVGHFDAIFRRNYTWIALPRILDFYQRRTALARDGAATIVGSRNASKALARVRADAAKSIDAAVVARELRDAVNTGWVPRCEMSFELRPWRKGEQPRDLAQTLGDQIARQATDLLSDVEALNDSLAMQANLLSAHANLKLQPLIIGLAAISMLAAVISTSVAVHDVLAPKSVPMAVKPTPPLPTAPVGSTHARNFQKTATALSAGS
jgi:hypothetical protein